jgi:hypothetical protein
MKNIALEARGEFWEGKERKGKDEKKIVFSPRKSNSKL